MNAAVETRDLTKRFGKNYALAGECTGTSVTLWTGDIRYESLAPIGA
jgi:hypothetical protein